MSFARRRGFTLVELIVVVLILGVLATVGVVGYTRFTERAELAAAQADMRSLATATAAQAALTGQTTLTRDLVRTALEENFGADVTVVEGSGASSEWTLLPADVPPTGPREVSVGFTDAEGNLGQEGEYAVFVTSTASGQPAAASVSAGGAGCSPDALANVWANYDITNLICFPLDLNVDDPACATSDYDSAYWVGRDTASWHRSAGIAYDPTIPDYFTYPAQCEPDFVRGYDDGWNA